MSVKLAAWGNAQFVIPSTGAPANGYKLYTYVANSSTPVTTFTTSAGNVSQSNPIVLNSAGFPTTGQIWITEGTSIKIVFTDDQDVVIKTEDNIPGVNDASVSQDQWAASGLTPTYVSATSFTLVGDQTSTATVGRRIKTTNSGGTVYSRITSSSFGGGTTTIVVQNDSGSLDSGLSAVSYGLISAANTSAPGLGDAKLFQARLTLTSGTPVTTSDVTAAETLYLTPFRGSFIDLYDSSVGWVRVVLSEISVDVPDATQMNDVFVYLSSGVPTLEIVAWTNDTTRATALTTQDGVYVKSGSVNKRYVGSFYATTAGNGQTEDSIAKRYLFNYYNRVRRYGSAAFTANRSTSSTSFVEVNTEIRNEFVVGVVEDAMQAYAMSASVTNNTNGDGSATSIGLDGTTAMETGFSSSNPVGEVLGFGQAADVSFFSSVGRHYVTLLGRAVSGGTSTWSGGATPGARTSLQTTLLA